MAKHVLNDAEAVAAFVIVYSQDLIRVLP
jgi:hypothetical protein